MVPASAAMTGVPRGAMMSTASCVRPPRAAVYESRTREGATPSTGMISPLAANAASGANATPSRAGAVTESDGGVSGGYTVRTGTGKHAASDTSESAVIASRVAQCPLEVAISN